MRMTMCLAALCAIMGSLLSTASFALDFGTGAVANGTVTWTLVDSEVSGNPGDTVMIRVKGEISKGWHTYTLKKYKAGEGPKSTVIELGPADMVSYVAGDVKFEPAPHVDKITSEQFGNDIEAFEDSVTVSIPVKIAATAKFDSQKLTLKISCQVCDAKHCKEPDPAELSPTLTLKKKVNEPAKDHTWTPKPENAKKEIDWILADQDMKLNVRPGERVFLNAKAMIKNEYHTFATRQDPNLKYAAVTTFSVEPKELAYIDGEIKYDHAPISLYDHTLTPPGNVDVFENAVMFSVPIRLNTNLKAGTVTLTLKIDSQACKDGQCVPIRAELQTEITVAGSAVAGASDSNGISKEKGLWAFLCAAALYGLVSLLTPCVFPKIPITVSFFTKRQHVSHTRAVRDALIFSFGIVLTFVGLGFFMALALGQSVRNLAANPWMNLAIFTVFMVMAGNLLGYYELQIPSGILNALNKKASSGNSVYSLLLMGLVFSLTSFTCTGPFVGTVMVWAVDGDWVWPMLGMAVFATVFAAPFFVLALFPTMLKSLPKSGGWLNSVKVVMGLVEIAAALKFLSSADLVWHWHIITHEVFVAVWIAIALATAAYLLGKIRFPHDTPLKKLSAVRVALAGAFVVAIGLLVADLCGKPGAIGMLRSYVPQRPYPPKVTDDWETGMTLARKQGKPVFFDFTGLTCVNCRLMEEDMFQRKEVEELLKNFIVVKLYTDARESDAEKAISERNANDQKDRYKMETLPFYAIVAPDGQDLAFFPDGYTQDEKEFTDFLKAALQGKTAAQIPAQATAQN